MFHTYWPYPYSGPAPPSPIVMSTMPAYFGGRPTPPSTPPGERATPIVDDYAPCPPTPPCLPPDAEQDQLSSSTSSGSHHHWDPPEPDHPSTFADPLTDTIPSEPDAQDDVPVESPNVSDTLLYAHGTYATPSPVLIMMQRANFDMYGHDTQPVDPSACCEPLKLFSLTGGRTPLTGLRDLDHQSQRYYNKRPLPPPLGLPESLLPCRYPISTIEALQHSLRTVWSSVYPPPIPPVVIRSRDVIEPSPLTRRLNGSAFVIPTEDSIWVTIRQRGVDLDYRPMDRSLTVETCLCTKGDALYFPQHIVASKFAVNVFLEMTDFATGTNSVCEYLGAYVLQAMDELTINRTVWLNIDPKIQQDVFNRAPDCFTVYSHSFGWPQLPFVRFNYYKWDRNILGLADEILHRRILPAGQGIAEREVVVESDSDDNSDDTDSDTDTDQYRDGDDDSADTDPAVDTNQDRDCNDDSEGTDLVVDTDRRDSDGSEGTGPVVDTDRHNSDDSEDTNPDVDEQCRCDRCRAQDATASVASTSSPEQGYAPYIDWDACA